MIRFVVQLLITCVTASLCSCYSLLSKEKAVFTVACVGDSITFGNGIEQRTRNSYPAQLGRQLGPQWSVRNFGVSGATLLQRGDLPYQQQRALRRAVSCEPDLVIIMLGSNDSKTHNWRHKQDFIADYIDLIHQFQRLPTGPAVWLAYPPPAYSRQWNINDTVIRGEICPLIDVIAEHTGARVIDCHEPLRGRPHLFSDTIHPNKQGAAALVRIIAASIRNHQSHETVFENAG
ncbi:MAG: GDSL-type esterase/lipase family protein [Planctomycetota bacterium]